MTRTLILMRHAKSSWSSPSQADHDRPLNARGRRGADALGEWLSARTEQPDQILCSTAQRTRETLDRLRVPAPATFDRALYLADPEDMQVVLSKAQGQTVLILGHNPGIADWAASLVDPAPDHPRFHDFPTGATLIATFPIDDWRDLALVSGKAVAFVTPHDLPGT